MTRTAAPGPTRPLTGARGVATQILRGLLWLMAAGIVVQVFLAGLFNFGEADARDTHENVGWIVHTIGMVALIPAIVGPRTKEAMLGVLALVVLNTVQIMLSGADTAAVAALHPTLALAVLALTLWLALRTRPSRRA